jgi:hypothetical protein
MSLFGIQWVHGKGNDIRFGPTLADAADDDIQRGVVTEVAAASMV